MDFINYINKLAAENFLYSCTEFPNWDCNGRPEVIPAEPITKPAPIVIPSPDKNDPFNVPAPLVNPTPKGFF